MDSHGDSISSSLVYLRSIGVSCHMLGSVSLHLSTFSSSRRSPFFAGWGGPFGDSTNFCLICMQAFCVDTEPYKFCAFLEEATFRTFQVELIDAEQLQELAENLFMGSVILHMYYDII